MVSPNGAQSLDRPLVTIGHGKPNNNLSDQQLQYRFNELLKTVISNSVAQEMHHQNPSSSSSSSSFQLIGNNLEDNTPRDRAIEDFLVRTGAAHDVASQIADGSRPIPAAAAATEEEEEWLQFQLAAAASVQQQQQIAMDSGCYGGRVPKYESSGFDVARAGVAAYNPEDRVVLSCVLPPDSAPSDSQAAAAAEKRQRCPEDLKEKTIERKQKRMIKNRESAARSRARKQAYTLRLEQEVLCLRKTNEWLKKKKEVETQILSSPSTSMAQKYQLRRIKSASF